MNLIEKLSLKLSQLIGLDQQIIFMIIISLLSYIIIKIVIVVISKIATKIHRDPRQEFIIHKRINLCGNLLFLLIILNIWNSYITDFITFISFFSAGVAIALRDLIFNFFCGIYIRTNKPFAIEDRVEIDGHLGDVIDIRSLSFSILEISNHDINGQSTGIIIHCPNALIFNHPLRNYTIGFKYIWNELEINIPLDADIKKTKSVLYRILNQNEILKRIPKKMEREIGAASSEYRLYYNKLDPIIYTKLDHDHICLQLRYLVHPKKARNVEDNLWNAIIDAYKKEEISLFINNS